MNLLSKLSKGNISFLGSNNTSTPSTHSLIETNVLNNLLYSGYIRTNCKSYITPEIINICQLFSDFICYHWILQPPQWARSAVTSPILSIDGINVQIIMKHENFVRSKGTKKICLGIQSTALNEEIDSITVKFNYVMVINGHVPSPFRANTSFIRWHHNNSRGYQVNKNIYNIPWMRHIQSITLKIYPEIFDIRYKDQTKRYYKHSKLHRKLRYKWDIDKSIIKLFETARKNQWLYSSTFGNSNWKLKFIPKSDVCTKDIKGEYANLSLNLYSLPTGIYSIEVKVTFRYKNQDEACAQISQTLGLEQVYKFEEFDYESKLTMDINWKKDTLLSSKLCEMISLYFIVDIEIVKVYDNTGTVIPKHKWAVYDIIDEMYTNMIHSNKMKLPRRISYRWNINNKILKLSKTRKIKYDSVWFKNWKLIFTPYGSDGYTLLRLELYSLPSLIRCIVAKVHFSHNKNNTGWGLHSEREFGLNQTDSLIMHTYMDKKYLLSSDLYQLNSLYFVVDIEIIKVYKTSEEGKVESVPIYEWERYGIVNETYTNIRNSKHAQMEQLTMEKHKYDVKSNLKKRQANNKLNVEGDVLNLILNKLDSIQSDITNIKDDVHNINERLTQLETKMRRL